MKKALTITIAGTLFTIEEDAYQRLDAYLDSIKTYFGTYPDSVEIVKDIEARIAEQLIENKPTSGIITIETVEKVILVMGKVEDFGDKPGADESHEKSESTQKSYKRFYRSTDDVVIAGVASGIAHYFAIDPLLVRLVFIILTFITSGGFIFIYIILALIIPKAETPAEKIQMRGGPVTLNSFKETVHEYAETVKKNSKEFAKTDSAVYRFITSFFEIIGKIIRFAVKIVAVIIAIGLIGGGIVGMFFVTFGFVNLSFNAHSQYVDFPLIEVMTGSLYYFLVTLAYIIFLIPLVALAIAGISLLRKKKAISLRAGSVLAGVWVIALIIAGSLFVRVIPEVATKISELPQYKNSTRMYDLNGFSKLELHGINAITIKQGDTFSVAAHGAQKSIDNINMIVKDETLVVTYDKHNNPQVKVCLFCIGSERADIEVTMPLLTSLETYDNVYVNAEESITSQNIMIATLGNSRVNLPLTASSTRIESSINSRVTLTGASEILLLKNSGNSEFEGDEFQVNNVEATLTGNSHSYVYALKSLIAHASGNSMLYYQGFPQVTRVINGNAEIINTQATSTLEENLE